MRWGRLPSGFKGDGVNGDSPMKMGWIVIPQADGVGGYCTRVMRQTVILQGDVVNGDSPRKMRWIAIPPG